MLACRTGEAKISQGYNLPARHVIHTVGPRYNVKYRTAAESALYNCYRSVMQLARSVGSTCVFVSACLSAYMNVSVCVSVSVGIGNV